MEMGKTIGQSIRSEDLGILQFGVFFCQPFGENTFSKNVSKRKNEKLEHYQVLGTTKVQLGLEGYEYYIRDSVLLKVAQ